jgi:hypothetical protein
MAAKMNTCPKCQARMEEGFLLDHTHGGRVVSTWVEGAPEQGRWSGLRIKQRRAHTTESWRCTACGFLETYAP